jgi:hypothetical protein
VDALMVYTAQGRPVRRAPGFVTSFVPMSDGDSSYAVGSQYLEVRAESDEDKEEDALGS